MPAYHAHGEELPRHLDGEFAVALADLYRRRLLLAVDAFGDNVDSAS